MNGGDARVAGSSPGIRKGSIGAAGRAKRGSCAWGVVVAGCGGGSSGDVATAVPETPLLTKSERGAMGARTMGFHRQRKIVAAASVVADENADGASENRSASMGVIRGKTCGRELT